jgi:hypothetical protein
MPTRPSRFRYSANTPSAHRTAGGPRKELVHKREALVAALRSEAKQVTARRDGVSEER